MQESISVIPYSDANLLVSLSNSFTPPGQMELKRHLIYFKNYLGPDNDGLDAKTIVIENDYVSRSYLIDYSNYYSTCFTDYNKFCKRVHFFKESFNETELFEKVYSGKHPELQDSYLGFIVIKPLPEAKIGATILRTFANGKTGRNFPSVKRYDINLLGVSLYINSLAFIEQDKVVGACASSALWSTFQKTSNLFQTPLPSPSDITKSAKNLFNNSGRIFPNEGLDFFQIGNAIESVGLVSELRNSDKLKDINWLKSFIYAYNKIGLPVLLGIEFESGGLHLISVVGYRENQKEYKRQQKISLKAESIERFYAHDDQIGPFSRIGFSNDPGFEIETSWEKEDGSKENASVAAVIVPLSNKIRIKFEDIYATSVFLHLILHHISDPQDIVWDIYLDFSNNYKKDILKSSASDAYKRKVISKNFPRYIWIAKCHTNSECICEFIFDATDIVTGNYCIVINIFEEGIRTAFGAMLTDLESEEFLPQHMIDLLRVETGGVKTSPAL